MSGQFHFKQFSLTLVQGFNVKNSSISNNSVLHKYTVYFYLPIEMNLSGTSTPGQSGPGNEGNKALFCLPPKLQDS